MTLDPHSDGAAPLVGAGAEIKPLRDSEQCATFNDGATLFTDRDYTAANLPSCVKGRRCLLASITGTSIEVVREGVIFAITPLPHRNKDSVVEQLKKQGFEKAAVREFRLFGSPANICCQYPNCAEIRLPGSAGSPNCSRCHNA